MTKYFDIIVVGGGHAGCEAAHAAAKLGSKVLLITFNISNVAQMSCNPAMGGIAKGQIVREIDALGGMSGIVTDKSMIQFRLLNRSKGPAMWSPRAQCDRLLFSLEWRKVLENTKNLYLRQDCVTELILDKQTIKGVRTLLGQEFFSKAVILTNGTFLNGIIHIGEINFSGGRIGEQSSHGLTEQLNKIGFESGRMKTGTPVRVDARSVDFSKMIEQKGDENPGKFSFWDTKPLTKQLSCWLVYTNPEVHEILRKGFDKSPLFQGRISGTGPRYCPSIEDKIERFSDKERHQLFVEPEGWEVKELYINGFSSSLPEDIQVEALKKIPGFEKVEIYRPGYAIEYDFFPPIQLKETLETKIIDNLYFAGQINGTTGYEEAACQGLIAGINAHRKINNLSPFVLKRSDAYIGVLINDLITKGVDEPYRMFTSRAEFRILLRQDNADFRLTPKGYEIGLIDEHKYQTFKEKKEKVDTLITLMRKTGVGPELVNPILLSKNEEPISQQVKLSQLLLRPNIHLYDFIGIVDFLKNFSSEIIDECEISIKYEGYIQKEQELAKKFQDLENIYLKPDFDYNSLKSLSTEARQKLSKYKPSNLAQAARISGVSPSDIAVLMLYLSK